MQADPLLPRWPCSCIVGGAVMAVDLDGAAVVLGRRTLSEVLGIAGCVHVPIWLSVSCYPRAALTGPTTAP